MDCAPYNFSFFLNTKRFELDWCVIFQSQKSTAEKYFSLQSDCNNCPIRNTCISDKAKTKKVQHSIYKAELERAKARQQTVKAKVMKRKRSSTVEPVWGTLINFTGMKRLNARGIKAANKMLVLAATVYNLKKWLKFTAPKTNIKVLAMLKTKAGEGFWLIKNILMKLILRPIQPEKIFLQSLCIAVN